MYVRFALLLALSLCALAGQAQTSGPLPATPAIHNSELSDAPTVQEAAAVVGEGPVKPVTALAAPPRPRVVDGKFIALTALTFGLTAVDVEMTQHCLAARTCYEMNPSLPDSRLGQYAINTATNLAVTWLSYRRKRDGKWGWWVAPVIDVGAHGVGIGTNIRFLGK